MTLTEALRNNPTKEQCDRAADFIDQLQTATAEMGRALNLAREREAALRQALKETVADGFKYEAGLRAERDALKSEASNFLGIIERLKAERDALQQLINAVPDETIWLAKCTIAWTEQANNWALTLKWPEGKSQ